jgi:hypothetical protein
MKDEMKYSHDWEKIRTIKAIVWKRIALKVRATGKSRANRTILIQTKLRSRGRKKRTALHKIRTIKSLTSTMIQAMIKSLTSTMIVTAMVTTTKSLTSTMILVTIKSQTIVTMIVTTTKSLTLTTMVTTKSLTLTTMVTTMKAMSR